MDRPASRAHGSARHRRRLSRNTSGRGRTPDFAVSLPLRVVHLTREYLDHDATSTPEQLRRVRRRVRHELRDVTVRMQWEGPRTAAATSRTFHQLGRLCGAAPGRQGVFVPRQLDRHDLKAGLRRLAELPAPARADLPGISPTRTRQRLTGAIIAHTAMRCLGIAHVTLSPWAVQEGVLLTQLQERRVPRERLGEKRAPLGEAQAGRLPTGAG
ncbi:hypothetical protein [Streptomyces mutabilis]|uniref:Ppx/GppA phosphatase family protein n=1 Tax=Streptomyces mutabilis TaxID=67332 RepID=UPI00398612C7